MRSESNRNRIINTIKLAERISALQNRIAAGAVDCEDYAILAASLMGAINRLQDIADISHIISLTISFRLPLLAGCFT